MKKLGRVFFARVYKSLTMMTALAVIFSLSGLGILVQPQVARAATTIVVTNATVNSAFPGAPIPASSAFPIDILKISAIASPASTLASVQIDFSGTGFEVGDLATLASDATSGVALYDDSGATAGTFDPGGDTVIALDGTETWTGTSVTLTPATPPTLTDATEIIFWVAIKTSGTITDGDQIQATIPIGGVVAGDASSGPSTAFASNYVQADTAPAAISSVEGYSGSNTLNVLFNKPVEKVGGGALVVGDTPFTFTDLGTVAGTSITAVSHTPGQDFATLTLSDNLDDGDFDGTPSTLAAGSNKIADMGGNVIGTSAVSLTSPFDISTPTIPTATVGAVYDNVSPLVAFSATGGTPTYSFSANTPADTTILSNAGLSIVNDAGTYKLTGTVLNIPGSYQVTIEATDGVAQTTTRPFTLNIAPADGGGIPSISTISPPGGAQGASGLSMSIVGANTSFSGSSTVEFLLNGSNDADITVSGVSSASATDLSFSVSIAGGATLGSRDVRVTTGTEIVTLPNGYGVFAGGASGLTLQFPTDGATEVQMPPAFNFNPSSDGTINSYRIDVNTTSDFSGTTMWDYVYPKPADAQNSNGSHCSDTSCDVLYGEGMFRIITPPTFLAPNTTYYWRVRTYTQTMDAFTVSDTAVESTPSWSLKTVTTMSDTAPPTVQHRPLFQATESVDLKIFARVMDNLATATSSPALSTTLNYCNTSNVCTPGTAVSGVSVGGGYYSYTITSGNVPPATGNIRYNITATDGTNTTTFAEPNGDPFTLVTATAGATTIAGTVKEAGDTCSTDVRQAIVFAEGTGFNTTSSNDINCTYTLANMPAGVYDLVAVKTGYSDSLINGIPTGSSNIGFLMNTGGGGGFGGDTTKPRVMMNFPMDGMANMPGNDPNFMIGVIFDSAMSQSTITSSNLTVSTANLSTGVLTDITANGSWTYYATAPAVTNLPPEGNMAIWSLSGNNTLGDDNTIVVSVSSAVTDTNGNAIEGNTPNGNYSFSFTTGSTADFTNFDADAGTFSGGGTFGEGAFVPPSVMGTTPFPGAFSVPLNTPIIINFSEAMSTDSGAYVLKNYIKLYTVSGATETDVSSTAINTVTLDSGKMNATVNLKSSYNSGALAPNTIYRLKVLGGAKAGTGITLSPPGGEATVMFMAEFKTGTSSDTAAPTILGTYPDANATGVPVSVGAVNVAFSKDMNASTITTSNVYLSVGSTTVSSSVDYDPLGRQVFIVPNTALSPNTTYTINVSTSVSALNGQALATALARTFTTGAADSSAPGISFGNADDYSIAITYSEPMNAAKVTDSINWATSVLNPATYNVIKYGAPGFNEGATGTTVDLTGATLSWDGPTTTVIIEGVSLTADQELYLSVDTTGSNVQKDLSGNAISGSTSFRAPILSSSATGGQLGPGAVAGDRFSQGGEFTPDNFSGDTFGFAPPVEVMPFSMMAGQATVYGIRIPISTQIPAGGSVVLTFPTGFDISGAKQDINSPSRQDLNGPGSGTVTFKCQTNVSGGKSCATTANSDDTGSAEGGLADDGVVVNQSARSITIYLSSATNVGGYDFLEIDIAGIINSTVPKDFNTSGYTVDVKTKDGSTLLESLTSMPFFIQSAGSRTVSGTITAASANTGTIQVYLMSPMTGPMETTSATFSSGTATYSFANLPDGDYMLFTDPFITLGGTEYTGKANPERVIVTSNTTYDFTLTNASAGGTNVTVSVDGPSGEPLDIFAGSTSGNFKVKQVTLDGSAGAENFTINLADGQWFVGVGPQMPKGFMGGPPPTPSYMPPKPEDITVTAGTPATFIENSGTANDGTLVFTLTTSTKSIKGLVQDGSGKVIANAEVYAYSPNGGFGTNAQADSAGAFTLGVTDGSYIVGAFVPGMPSSKEVPVVVTSDANTYLLIDGATTAITPATASTTFILKVDKPDYTISGKITDGTNSVQGASVYAYRTDGPGNAHANTDNSGNYTLYVSDGTWNVGAFLPQYGELSEVAVTVNGANVTNQNFSPSGTGTFYAVSGTVTSGGSNVQGAFVRLTGNGTFNEAITGADGVYSFKVPEGNGYVVSARIPGVGEAPPLAPFNVSGSDVTGKNITVGTLRTITITFSSSVSKAFVDLFGSTGIGNFVEITDATTGTLSLPDGDYKVNVDTAGIPISATDIAGTDANTAYDSTTGIMTVNGNEGLTITLPTLRTVSGTVTDGSNPVADAWVEIVNFSTGVNFGMQSATDGTFSLQVADSAVDYDINAMKPGYFSEPSNLTVNGADVTGQTLVMGTASTTISGQVLIGASGVANAFVRAERQGGGFSGTQADANGNYVLPLNAGVWRIYAVAEGYAEVAYASNPIDVTGGSVAGKDITLTDTVSLDSPKSKPITPASGGTLEDTTAGIKLTIPASALGNSTSAGNVQVRETNNIRPTATALPLGDKAKNISATDADGNPITSNFVQPVTIEMSYTKAELATTRSASDSAIDSKDEVDDLKMAYWDETTQNWVTKPTTVTYKDSSGNIITDTTTIDTAAEFDALVDTVTIAAQTDHFSLYAPIVATDPSAPATPSDLSASASSSSQISLSWTEVSGATSYDIYRSTTSGGTFARLGSEPTVSSGSTTTYSDTGLSAGTTYYYKITSLNASGESASSSEVSATTSSSAGSGSGGGGGLGYLGNLGNASRTQAQTETTDTPSTETPASTPETPASSTPTSTEENGTTTRARQINKIIIEASNLKDASPEGLAATVGKVRDTGLEARYEASIIARIVTAETPAVARAKVLSFVTYGTPTTLSLGAGERGGVVNSFREAFGRTPETEADWQNVLKIANGRWPSNRNTERESSVEATFRTIYLREADRSNPNDDAAITVMAYGLRPSDRNLDSEKSAIKIFKAIFGSTPDSATDWDTVRAIAYSGATR